jgi:hypothetical protein
LAVRNSDKQLILRLSRMCADDDEEPFKTLQASFLQHEQSLDPSRQTQEIIGKNGGFIPLPMIMNKKTVDPKDDSPKGNSWKRPGATIECFERIRYCRATRVCARKVQRLVALRSDAYS